jgi:hypothetical protein
MSWSVESLFLFGEVPLQIANEKVACSTRFSLERGDIKAITCNNDRIFKKVELKCPFNVLESNIP